MGLDKFSEEVQQQIEKIVIITDRINNYRGRVPSIEIDLAMEEIRRLYNCFVVMKSMTEDTDYRYGAGVESFKEDKPAVEQYSGQEQETASDMDDAVETNVEDEEQNATVVPDPVKEEETQQMEAPVISAKREPEENVKEKEKKGAILADKFTRSGNKSINDLVSAGRLDVSISSRMQHNPISNLKSAIGINEKFIFVYELFSGNSQRYSEVIDRLNNMPGREEAIALMESLREEFRWDIENMAFQKLVDMVARRYS